MGEARMPAYALMLCATGLLPRPLTRSPPSPARFNQDHERADIRGIYPADPTRLTERVRADFRQLERAFLTKPADLGVVDVRRDFDFFDLTEFGDLALFTR